MGIVRKISGALSRLLKTENEPGYIHIKTPEYEFRALFNDRSSMLRMEDFICRECDVRGYYNDDTGGSD